MHLCTSYFCLYISLSIYSSINLWYDSCSLCQSNKKEYCKMYKPLYINPLFTGNWWVILRQTSSPCLLYIFQYKVRNDKLHFEWRIFHFFCKVLKTHFWNSSKAPPPISIFDKFMKVGLIVFKTWFFPT